MRSIVVLSAAAFFLLGAVIVGGQGGGRGQAPAGRAIPSAPDGKPDLSGIWQVLDNSLDGNIEPHAASYGVHGGQGGIVDPPDGKIPYLPSALARRQENYKNRARDPVAYCFKPGVPRITYIPFPFQITQTPTMIQVNYEFVHSLVGGSLLYTYADRLQFLAARLYTYDFTSNNDTLLRIRRQDKLQGLWQRPWLTLERTLTFSIGAAGESDQDRYDVGTPELPALPF